MCLHALLARPNVGFGFTLTPLCVSLRSRS